MAISENSSLSPLVYNIKCIFFKSMLFAVRFIMLLLNQLLCGNPSNPISCPQCSVLIHYKRKKLVLVYFKHSSFQALFYLHQKTKCRY